MPTRKTRRPSTQAADPPPVIGLGSGAVVAPVIRTTVQGAIVEAVIRLATVLPSPDLAITDGDQALIRVIGLAAVTAIQNVIEARAGRQLLGRSPAPAVAPPHV